MHEAVEFLHFVLKDMDSRPLFRKKVADARSRKNLSPVQQQQLMADYLLLICCTETDLITKLVTPIEQMFGHYITTEPFIEALLDYYVLSVLDETKAFDVSGEKAQKHFGHKFCINIKHLNLDISYRKWQIDRILDEL